MEQVSTDQLFEKAIEFGADLCGLARVADLICSPSNILYPLLGGNAEVTSPHAKTEASLSENGARWPADGKTILVIAIQHPENEPELDWWQRAGQPGGTIGNWSSIRVVSRISEWLEHEKGISAKKIPYQIEAGGIFLKDAAVLAGMGVIGRNNMLITPSFGPRVRLRALCIPLELASTGMLAFDPCQTCPGYCRLACPESAFSAKQYSAMEAGIDDLPGRDGAYSRTLCHLQMMKNEAASERHFVRQGNEEKETTRVHFCRECEFACPVGRDERHR